MKGARDAGNSWPSLLSLFAAAPCAGQAAGSADARRPEAHRRHFGRPILGRPVRRIPSAFHRRARAARQRHGVPQRLPGPCRDRDLSRPFDDPDRIASVAYRDHRQQLVRPVAARGPTRPSIAPRTSACRASSTTSYTVSPMHLRVPTLGDLLKQQSPPSLNVAVAGKDRAAVMMGGHAVDQRWYWDGKTFVTDLKSAPCRARRSPRRTMRSPPPIAHGAPAA